MGNLNWFPLSPEDPAGVSVPMKIGLVTAAAAFAAAADMSATFAVGSAVAGAAVLAAGAAVLLAAPLAIGGTVSTQQITGFESHERSAVMVPVPPRSCCRWSRLTFQVGGGGTVPVVVGGTQGSVGQIGNASAEFCKLGTTATARPMAAITATTVRPRRRRRRPRPAQVVRVPIGASPIGGAGVRDSDMAVVSSNGCDGVGTSGFTGRRRISRPCTGTGTR